jgi:lipopolysaccharide export system permease protein
MKKTLYLYLCREITVPFLLGMATFTSMLLMGRLLKLADLVVAKGVPLGDVMLMLAYLIPSFSLVTIPMAFLLALLLAFGRLSTDSEVTAMKANGVSLYDLLPPVLCYAMAAYLLTAFLTVYALPWGNTSFKKLLYEVVEARATLMLKEKVFNDDFPGLVLYTDRFNEQEHTMGGILIQDERDLKEPSTVFADSGVVVSDPKNRTIRLQLRNGGIHRGLGETGYRLIEFREYDLSINLGQVTREIARNERDMSFDELKGHISAGLVDVNALRDFQMEFHRRFALPFACFVFSLVGVPLGIQNQRSGKASGFSISIGILLIYYIVLSVGKTLGGRGIVHPIVAAWAPNLFFLTLGVYLFRQVATERRIFILDAVPAMIKRLRIMLSPWRDAP